MITFYIKIRGKGDFMKYKRVLLSSSLLLTIAAVATTNPQEAQAYTISDHQTTNIDPATGSEASSTDQATSQEQNNGESEQTTTNGQADQNSATGNNSSPSQSEQNLDQNQSDQPQTDQGTDNPDQSGTNENNGNQTDDNNNSTTDNGSGGEGNTDPDTNNNSDTNNTDNSSESNNNADQDKTSETTTDTDSNHVEDSKNIDSNNNNTGVKNTTDSKTNSKSNQTESANNPADQMLTPNEQATSDISEADIQAAIAGMSGSDNNQTDSNSSDHSDYSSGWKIAKDKPDQTNKDASTFSKVVNNICKLPVVSNVISGTNCFFNPTDTKIGQKMAKIQTNWSNSFKVIPVIGDFSAKCVSFLQSFNIVDNIVASFAGFFHIK